MYVGEEHEELISNQMKESWPSPRAPPPLARDFSIIDENVLLKILSTANTEHFATHMHSVEIKYSAIHTPPARVFLVSTSSIRELTFHN